MGMDVWHKLHQLYDISNRLRAMCTNGIRDIYCPRAVIDARINTLSNYPCAFYLLYKTHNKPN